jgi:colanic acid/amylovoran biosynthesis protein
VRVLLTNCVLLNTGDAAIAVGIVERLRAVLGAGAEFVVAGNRADVSAKYYPELRPRPLLEELFEPLPRGRRFGRVRARARELRLVAGAWCTARRLGPVTRLWLGSRAREALAEYRRADAVVATGGTYLVEAYPIAGRLLELRVALAMRKPVVLYTQSLGPFRRPENRRAVRSVLRRADLVLLRDDRSRAHLAEIGVDGDRVRVVADAAFALAPPAPHAPAPGMRVAVSVRAWPFAAGDVAGANDRYSAAIAALVERLVRAHGAQVTFLSTCQGVPEYWYDDSQVAQEIADGLPPDVSAAVRVDRDFHAPADLVERLGAFDLVVATRMHMAILALVAGAPVLPLAYEFKTRELFERLGLAEWVRDFEAVGAEELPDLAERCIAALPEIRRVLPERVAAERALAATAGDLAAAALRDQLVDGRRATTA